MLKIKFRNIIISAPDHDDLLRDEVNRVMASFQEIFNISEHALRRNPPNSTCYSIIRLKSTMRMIVAYIPSASNNPYLFLWDKESNDLYQTIPFELLRKFKANSFVEELRDAVKDMNSERFLCLRNEAVTTMIEDAVFVSR